MVNDFRSSAVVIAAVCESEGIWSALAPRVVKITLRVVIFREGSLKRPGERHPVVEVAVHTPVTVLPADG